MVHTRLNTFFHHLWRNKRHRIQNFETPPELFYLLLLLLSCVKSTIPTTFPDYQNSLYVCLRKYRGLKSSGFSVLGKAVSYQAFQLTVKFKYVADSPESEYVENNSGMFLVVIAVPVYTSYKGKWRCDPCLRTYIKDELI